MATTSVVAEMVSAGVFGLLWLGCLLDRLSVIDLDVMLGQLARNNSTTLLVLAALVAAYQLGSLVNALAHSVTRRVLQRGSREKIFRSRGLEYRMVRAVVYQRGSPALIRDLMFDRSIVRLARTGSVNFLVLGVIQLSYGSWPELPIGALCMLASVGSVLQLVFRYRRYYRAVLAAYDVITSSLIGAGVPPAGA